MYTYIKRASAKDKSIFDEIISSLNELAPESAKATSNLVSYTWERSSSSYVVVARFEQGGEDRASLVRCKTCGGIRELFDGQIEFCDECDIDW